MYTWQPENVAVEKPGLRGAMVDCMLDQLHDLRKQSAKEDRKMRAVLTRDREVAEERSRVVQESLEDERARNRKSEAELMKEVNFWKARATESSTAGKKKKKTSL